MEERERKHLHSSFIQATNTCSSNLHAVQTNIEGPSEPLEHVTWLLHGSYLPYLYPSCSAGLNSSHQAGSDSSYVDSVPNVVWRLGEHEIRPSRASLRDVIPSLNECLATTVHVCMRMKRKCSLTRHAWLTYFPNSDEPEPSVRVRRPPTPPPLHGALCACLFYFPPSPVIPCTTAATVMDWRPKKNPLALPQNVTHKHTPWTPKRR